ncbi:MAG: helix-turn-helix transcriptional regulator [Candidatus Sulfotelmatobacter sp.]
MIPAISFAVGAPSASAGFAKAPVRPCKRRRSAMLLADGHPPAKIAEMLGVSRNTLKSQLTSIYGKTGTSRQSQLVRLLLRIVASPSARSQ